MRVAQLAGHLAHAATQIFAEMNGNYYKEDFDTSRHVLESLDQLDQPGIEVYRSNKYKELQAVSSRASGDACVRACVCVCIAARISLTATQVSTRLSELVTKNKGEFLRELEV
jgi:hypothetical protein